MKQHVPGAVKITAEVHRSGYFPGEHRWSAVFPGFVDLSKSIWFIQNGAIPQSHHHIIKEMIADVRLLLTPGLCV